VQIRDAVPEDASAACEVLRRSISELCGADHRNDPEILTRWLANKTPEIVGSWIIEPGNSVLVAVEDGCIFAVGSVTTRVRSLSTMYRRTQGFVVLVEPCSLPSKQERSNEALIDAPFSVRKRPVASIDLPDMVRTVYPKASLARVCATRCPST